MKQKGFAQIFIVILLLAILGGVIYFGMVKGKSSSVTSSPTPSSASTANWKTYNDPNGKYSFRYPESATVKVSSVSQSPVTGQTLSGWYESLFFDSAKYDNEATIAARKNIGNNSGVALTESFENNTSLVLYIKLDASHITKVEINPVTEADQIIATIKFTSTGLPANTLSMTGTLQDFLKTNCITGNPQYLDLSKLPVNIDLNVITPYQASGIKPVYCSSVEQNTIKSASLYLRISNTAGINIYDDESQELGHGGAPGLGFFGQKILDQNGIQFGAWIQGGDGPQVLGSVGIILRGVKQFTTKDGHNIYVNYTETAIPGSDQRLIDQLKPFATSDPSLGLGPNDLTINYDQTMTTKIINYFYGKTPSSITPEGHALQDVTTILSAVTAK